MVSRRSFLTATGTATAAVASTPWAPLAPTAAAAGGAALPVRLADNSGHDAVYASISASGLQAQHALDGAPWDRPVVTGSSGAVLRVMSPVHSPVGFGSPDARGATAARLSAALNRGALLVPGGDNQPDGVPPSGYYQERS